MNNWTGIGRTTKEIELKYSQSGTAIASFTLAVNRQFKNQNGERETDFIRCIAFGKTGETLAQYVKKGQQLGIEGRIQTGSYENNEGKRVYTTDVVVNQFTFVSENKGQQSTNMNNSTNNTNQSQQAPQVPKSDGQQIDISDEDLPF